MEESVKKILTGRNLRKWENRKGGECVAVVKPWLREQRVVYISLVDVVQNGVMLVEGNGKFVEVLVVGGKSFFS